LVFCVIIRRPLFILLPFFPLGLPDYPVHIFKPFLICNQIVENKYIIVNIRHIESLYARMSRVSFSFRSE
jgi:hypothetical protein